MADDVKPLAEAVSRFQAGDLQAAERQCRSILSSEPDNAEALHLLSVIAHRTNNNQAAVELVKKAINADSKNASYYNTLGFILRILRQYDQAAVALRQAIELKEDYPDAHNNLGIALAESGQLQDAAAAYERALSYRPEFPEVQNNLGNLYYRMGRLEDAAAAYEVATALRPDYAEAHANRGDAFANQGDMKQAMAAYRKATEAAPNWAAGWYKLGNALFQQEQFDKALAAFRRCIDINPNQPRVLTNLGASLEKLGQYEEAAMMLRHAVVLSPDDVASIKNLGHVILKLGHVGEGLHLLRRAVELKPDDADAQYTFGNALLRMERLQEALNCYAKVRELTPDAARAYFAPAAVLLMNGQFKEGWAAYDSRFKMAAYKSNVPNVMERLWDGSPLGNKRLLVHVEQGFGDTLQFVRYIPVLRARHPDARIILVCEPELHTVLTQVEGYDEIHPLGSKNKIEFEYQVPLLSLPNRLGTTLETIPVNVPYVAPPPDAKAALNRSPETKLAVGIVWAGRPTHSDDRFRSSSIKWFSSLFDVPGVEFFSLQWGPRSKEIEPFLERGNVHSMTDQLTNFGETAALIKQLDLVIAIDTAVAHLTGALGKPVWTLLPFGGEWRWLFRREDTPWYPNMRLFRQRILGDWRPVFQRVRAGLIQLTADKADTVTPMDTAIGQHDSATEPGSAETNAKKPAKKSSPRRKAAAKKIGTKASK